MSKSKVAGRSADLARTLTDRLLVSGSALVLVYKRKYYLIAKCKILIFENYRTCKLFIH